MFLFLSSWKLSDITCAHALACINFMKHLVEEYVNEYYFKDNHLKMYEFVLQPINEYKMWPTISRDSIRPQAYKKMPDMPKKNRRIDPNEDKKSSKIKKRHVSTSFKLDITREDVQRRMNHLLLE